MHGEDVGYEIAVTEPAETPPRAWGRLPLTLLRDRQLGNTPTCMGKTIAKTARLSVREKHPHVHGEDDTLRIPLIYR